MTTENVCNRILDLKYLFHFALILDNNLFISLYFDFISFSTYNYFSTHAIIIAGVPGEKP